MIKYRTSKVDGKWMGFVFSILALFEYGPYTTRVEVTQAVYKDWNKDERSSL